MCIKKDNIYKQGLIFATKEGMKWQKRLQRFRTQLYLRAWVMCQPRIVQNCRPIELNSTRKSNRDTCFIVKYQSTRFNPVLISWNIEIEINTSDWTQPLWPILKILWLSNSSSLAWWWTSSTFVNLHHFLQIVSHPWLMLIFFKTVSLLYGEDGTECKYRTEEYKRKKK